MRRGYTLIEIIMTVAITGILSVGMFKAFEAITARTEKAKALTTLSLDSQSALDHLSVLLYHRIPVTVQEKASDGTWQALDDEEGDFRVLEWYGTASESHQNGNYSAFIDLADSNRSSHTLLSPDTLIENVRTDMRNKWNDPAFTLNDLGLVFSGTFDEGSLRDDGAPYRLDNASSATQLILSNPQSPMRIYEKYYLIDSAYAVALGSQIDHTAQCIRDLNLPAGVIDTTLFVFYGYRPWKTGGLHFCADPDNPDPDGKAAVLSLDVDDFRASDIDNLIRLKLNMKRNLRGNNPLRVSKQKVVF